MNISRILLFVFLSFVSVIRGQSLFIGSNTNEKLTLESSAYIHVSGLTILPSSDYSITDTKLSKLLTTSNTINSSINRSYYFTKAIPSFSGSIKIAYSDSELNSLNENGLYLRLFDGNNWEEQTTTNTDTTQNNLTATVNNKTISELTLNANKAPTDILLSQSSFQENINSGSIISTMTAVDQDSADTHTFSLTDTGDARDDDNGSFNVSGTSLVTNDSFDYETKNSYSIYLKVSDGSADFYKAFTLSVSNVNEPITDIGFAGASSLEYLVVGGGGAGGYGNSNEGGGGGGAGGYLTGTITSTFGETFTITVGVGGTGVNSTGSPGGNGGSSSLLGQNITTITALGGGGGGGCANSGSNGASGGGGSGCGTDRPGGSGTLGQGNSGGRGRWIGNSPGNGNGGGGGGSSSAGTNGASRNAGNIGGAGSGTLNEISGSAIIYAAGGDGGPGRAYGNYNPPDQTGNSGNGGIGGTNYSGGNGANGIVVLRYNGNPIATGGTITQSGGYTIHSFTQLGNSSIVFQGGSATSSSSSVDEQVSIGTLVGSLFATDEDSSTPTFTLVSGNGDTHNSLFTISGDQLLVNGFIDYEQTPSLSIRVQVSDGQFTFAKALTISVNDVDELPIIISTELAGDNSVVSVTFSESVYGTSSGSGSLDVNDFQLTLSGGTAGLSSPTPSSISQLSDSKQFILGIPFTGVPSGNELLTVVPVANSIYDSSGINTASTTQSSNTVNLFGDSDGDGVNDPLDQCPNTPSDEQADSEGCAESQKDPDNDGISGVNDNCPNTYNPVQEDNDKDGIGDLCDVDDDNDGVLDNLDNCPKTYNPEQENFDGDSMGDLCDPDDDNDNLSDILEQTLGLDPLDDDTDDDSYADGIDVFPSDPTEWIDTDEDGIGNNIDPDDDNDGFSDIEDSFPFNPLEWFDNDQDGIGDNEDKDDDNDGFIDINDIFPLDETEWLDTDEDGIGNNSDLDDDNDGYYDIDEIDCESDPLISYNTPKDFDQDLIPDCIDNDDDNDGCEDEQDLWPFDPNQCLDTDDDGYSDTYDWDIDNDGIPNHLDAFPYNPNESEDVDGDGIGDNQDSDLFNDGLPDNVPIISSVLTPKSSGIESMWKIANLELFNYNIVRVYSPDGNRVFKAINYKNNWRGINQSTSKPLPTGPYLYEVYYGKSVKPITGWLYIFN